jgi:hypothetical protein
MSLLTLQYNFPCFNAYAPYPDRLLRKRDILVKVVLRLPRPIPGNGVEEVRSGANVAKLYFFITITQAEQARTFDHGVFFFRLVYYFKRTPLWSAKESLLQTMLPEDWGKIAKCLKKVVQIC